MSGAKDETERPVLAAAILRLRDGEADLLLVSSLDRLARSVTVQEAVLAVIWATNGMVATADHGVVSRDDPTTRGGRRCERDGRRHGWAGLAAHREAAPGRSPGDGGDGGNAVGRYSYGWNRDDQVENEHRVLQLIRQRSEAGATWEAVADELNCGEFRPRSAACWTSANLSKVARRAAMELHYI